MKAGRLTLDVPTTFPEGTVLELTVADPGDELDAVERRALHAALEEGWKSAQEGRRQSAAKLLARLQKKR